MFEYDFIEEEIKSLIRKIKEQDYEAGKYLEDNIVISDEGILLKDTSSES